MAKPRSTLDTVPDGINLDAVVPNGHQAAAPPYRIVDRRSSYGFNNTLIEAATQTQDRKAITLVDYDFHRTISVIGRRTLMSLARSMIWKIPPLWSAIQEQATLSVSPFTPLYLGKNKAWGEEATEWLQNWYQVQDIASWPYDGDSYNELVVMWSIVDGDIFTLLTQDNSGNPRTQLIPSHRIGSRYQTSGVAKVRFESNQLWIDDKLIDPNLPYTFGKPIEWDAQQIDGVIMDDLSRAIAYRVYSDPAVSADYQDISARNLFPAFQPIVPGQVRNVSMLANSVFDWQDWREFRRFELLAQKTFASKTIVETNESGELDTAKALISSPAQFDADGKKIALDVMQLDGGAYHVFKAGTNSKLEAFDWRDRPGRNSQDFMDASVRDAMTGTEWSAFFSLDPAHIGGAPMRVIVDRINRTLKKRRRLVKKNRLRTDVYALAKAIKSGQLPPDPDFYRWTYQGPVDVTADRRYDAITDQMEYAAGWKNLEDIQASRNGDWRQKRKQRLDEVRELYTAAAELAEEFGISIQEAANRIEISGTVNFSMARRDSGDEALAEDTDSGLKNDSKNGGGKKKKDSAATPPAGPITLNIENRAGGKKHRKLIFNRDSKGLITTAEIEEKDYGSE